MTDMMEMTHELRNGALILRPMKRIDSSTAKSFEEQTNALIAGGAKKVVMDFSGLDYISSAGLRVVLTTAKRARAEGGGLTLCGVQSNVKDVLEVSGFASIFGVHANVDEALKAAASLSTSARDSKGRGGRRSSGGRSTSAAALLVM